MNIAPDAEMSPAAGLPVELRGATALTLMWAHEHEVEPAALNQLRNIAALPWVHGVRVMITTSRSVVVILRIQERGPEASVSDDGVH